MKAKTHALGCGMATEKPLRQNPIKNHAALPRTLPFRFVRRYPPVLFYSSERLAKGHFLRHVHHELAVILVSFGQ